MPDSSKPARRSIAPPDRIRPAIALGILALGLATVRLIPADEPIRIRDPAAWGSDHVGQEFPEYLTGDECLFCHRPIGESWQHNRHQLTVRPAAPDDPALRWLRERPGGPELAEQVQYLLGSRRTTRFLKSSPDYGKLEVLSIRHRPRSTAGDAGAPELPGPAKGNEAPHWDATLFGDRCAGCHATAVSAETRAFSALALDCVVCHGVVDLAHTKDTRRVLLSSRPQDARQVASICGQCHLRGGHSQSTGRPYPNTFVAGDNLFRDFQMDLSDAAIRALPVIERHIFLSARDAAVTDGTRQDCLACHDVHDQSTDKHQQLPRSAICETCHRPGDPENRLREGLSPNARRTSHNRVCDY